MESISRRTFVGAAGMTAAAVAGAPVLQGMAMAEDCAYQTEFEGETEDIAPVDPPASWDYEADIVVIGAGGGMSGALRALDLGASAVVIEKLPSTGGETQEACVFAFTSGNQCQLDAGLPDVTEDLRDKFYSAAPFGAKQHPFIDNVIQGAKDLIAWTTEQGFEWEPGECVNDEKVYAVCPKGSAVNRMNYRSMSFYTDWLARQIEDRGGQFLLSTEAQALVMDDGAVVGVQATAEDGSTIHVKANKGVLISTNGIAGNRAMLAKYAPDGLRCKVEVAGHFVDGKGIRMGLGAGANFGGYNQIGLFDGGLDSMPWDYMLYAAGIQLCRQPWLGIDVHGDRYPYGTTGLSGFTAQGKLLHNLPGRNGYVIFDDDWYENSLGFDQQMCRIPLDASIFGEEQLERIPESMRDYHANAQEAIDTGLIESADTIEELAEKLGLDTQTLVDAVDNYNAIVDAGTDPDGPYADHPEYLKPIKKAPFHGAKQGAMLYATSAGLDTNEYMQVMDTKGQVIPGLYATGAAVARDVQVCGSSCFANTSAFLAVNNELGA
ncbi:MAG: FAD-binding protein [Coriobacteriales bacterium]|jgi:fumarate reductase flavoprotein subunit